MKKVATVGVAPPQGGDELTTIARVPETTVMVAATKEPTQRAVRRGAKCYLCHGAHVIRDCDRLEEAQVYIKGRDKRAGAKKDVLYVGRYESDEVVF